MVRVVRPGVFRTRKEAAAWFLVCLSISLSFWAAVAFLMVGAVKLLGLFLG